MIVAVVDCELEGFLTEGFELVDLVGVLVSIDHAQSFGNELVAVDVVHANHVVRGGGGALLLVAVDVEVVVVRAIVDQTTHVASVGVVSEQDRLVFGEQVSEVSVGDSLIVLLGGLQLDQIHNVDDLELDAELAKGAAAWDWASTAKTNDEAQVVLAAAGDVPTQEIMAASDKLKALGIKFKVVNVADLLSLQSAKENDEALTDEEFADIFTADKPVLFAYHSYAHDVRGLIYDRPNHDNFNVHGYEEEGSTTTPYDMVRVNELDRYELTAEALRMIDADKYADEIQKLEDFRQEAFQFAVDKGYDHPDYTDWVYSGVKTDKKGAVTATAATAGDNE